MLIHQFRKYSPLNILLIIGLGIVMGSGILLNFSSLYSLVDGSWEKSKIIPKELTKLLTPYAGVWISMVLIILQGLSLNRLITHYNIFKAANYLTAGMYISLSFALPDFLIFTPVVLCNFILIRMLGKLFQLGVMNEVRGLMFDMGLLIALGTLLYYPFIAVLPLLWVALYVFRSFWWKEWIAPLFGFGVVYFMVALVYYIQDELHEFLPLLIPSFKEFHLPSSIHGKKELLILIPVVPTLILSAFALQKYFYKSVVHLRQSFIVISYMIGFLVLSFFVFDSAKANHFLLLVPGLSIVFAYYYTYAVNKWIYESLFALLIVFAVFLQYV